jgi:ribose 5-phosphate isomerase B
MRMHDFTVYLAADHAGFELKEFLGQKLTEAGYAIADCGADVFNPNDDYPVIIARAAERLKNDSKGKAIILGKTGQGEAIEANRHTGIRAIVYYGGPLDIITLSREHNDANVLSLGAGFLTKEEAWRATQVWLNTQFSHEERHVRRIQELDD